MLTKEGSERWQRIRRGEYDPEAELQLILASFEGRGFSQRRVELFTQYWRAAKYSRAWKILRKKVCGARRGDGRECMLKPVPGKTRCRFHGGASNGPTTEEGIRRRAEAAPRAARIRWERHRAAKAAAEKIDPFS